jgi:hypothetical protein
MAKKAPRSWGSWTEGKLDILAKYLDRFTTTTKHKADARIYLDAFAGEGHGTSRTTRSRFEGSARIGLKVSDPPFNRCYYFELPEKAAELRRELTRDFPCRDNDPEGDATPHPIDPPQACRHGHPLVGDNVHISSEGRATCRACGREATARHRARQRAANPPPARSCSRCGVVLPTPPPGTRNPPQ